MKFIVTIDTEGDNQWDHGRDLTVENIRFVPRFQALCEEFGIKPTYLVTSEVCQDSYAKVLFTELILKECAEVGAHLHSWTTPPFLDSEGFRENDANHAFASELPYDLLNNKIANLTEQIYASFGKRPTSFRSGRYGFNQEVAKSLAANSYIVDSSVTPFVSWSEHKGIPGGKGGPDFIDSPAFPFKYSFPDGTITEIPITILPTRVPLTLSNKLAHYYFRNVNDSLALRGLRKLFFSNQPIWLRPVPGTDLKLLAQLVNVTIARRLPFITMMFHSSELMPGCSKYRPDSNSVEELYRLLSGFFKLLRTRGIASATLTQAAQGL
jgi:hypothetical protein